ncbi:heme-binding protein [Streptomyces uncialis]|uniref:GlcG/HbpS family heme-binding protein n=1 Tax=Streptomyces uncialis TaxID=1048205 RepID=UPI00386DB8B4|nr:heme-binding protein [Streptomyces uncialis]
MNNTTTYDRPTVSYATASRLVAAGVRAAEQLGVRASIVVVDTAGEPVATARTDSAGMLSLTVASDKAWTAANAGAPTEGVHAFVASDPAAMISMPTVPRFTLVAGGIPLISDGRPVGAIGVSGGSSAQDARIAQDALAEIGGL